MLEEKVSYEVATKEVEQWLDKMKVSEKRRSMHKGSIDEIVSGVMNGSVTFKEGSPEWTLEDPPGEDNPLFTTLHFKSRFSVQQIQDRTKQYGVSDEYGRIIVNASLATGVGYGPLSKMRPPDFATMTHFVVFF